jgi:glutathione peroxidase
MGNWIKLKKLKRFFIVVLILVAISAIYVQIVNRHSINMTYRQKLLKAFYPALMWLSKGQKGKIENMPANIQTPPVSFYTLKDTMIDGTTFDFVQLKGKKVLLVNTASDCGYTEQYKDLQKLYEDHKNKLVIIGFPANDFKEQEKGSNTDIATFCQRNFGVSFPLMQKSSVIKSDQQNEIFGWLTDAAQNGWNSQYPSWNFSKYLVDENGVLTHYFDPAISPLSKEVLAAMGE